MANTRLKEETTQLIVLKNMQDMIKSHLDNMDKTIERIVHGENRLDQIDKSLFLISEDIKEIKKMLDIKQEDKETLIEILNKYRNKKFWMKPSFAKATQ
jgi:hypothetical protein